MLKIIGSVCVLFGCSALGFYFVSQMKKRLQELSFLRKLLFLMEGEIRHGLKSLPEIMIAMKQKCSGEWALFFQIVGRRMLEERNEPLAVIWKNVMLEALQVTSLSREQKKEWEELGNNLGYLDREMQLVLLQISQEHFGDFIEEERERYKKHARLYQTLGVMSGIFLVVILI